MNRGYFFKCNRNSNSFYHEYNGVRTKSLFSIVNLNRSFNIDFGRKKWSIKYYAES